eukprot:TRINITY_DN102914_c0_g1_i1.p1 TRINITY_DN102914_c0_g1~~TRINITY_DN102914_c0_g1_i1.p1  ORF type:complete len:480 (+),score=116.50 TRINITY_DN102914_c0_g1_i1:156-1595(+)
MSGDGAAAEIGSGKLLELWLLFIVAIVGPGLFDLAYLSPRTAKRISQAAAATDAARAASAAASGGGGGGDGQEAAEDAQQHSAISKAPFLLQVAFWLLVGCGFNICVGAMLGPGAAGSWFYGYALEYMLSLDNLFVFRVIFQAYSTPAKQIDTGLFFGISAAVLLRVLLFGLGTELLELGFVPRLCFGLALIYSGVKTLRSSDDDDDDPQENFCVRALTKCLPLHHGYAEDGSFFIRVSETGKQGPLTNVIGRKMDEQQMELSGFVQDHETWCAEQSKEHTGLQKEGVKADLDAESGDNHTNASTTCSDNGSLSIQSIDNGSAVVTTRPAPSGEGRLKVTLLFLVVASLGLLDVIFAVDSVTAKISSVSGFAPAVNFYLNLTSSAFAMFVLRSLYFVLDVLVETFRFLGLGVGFVLVIIGVKLILSEWYEVDMVVSMSILLSILALSMVASVVLPKPVEEETAEEPTSGAAHDGVEAKI